ncbi:MAG: ribosome maturation factor RimP [Gammaproteobacteria bacterium]|nr:MAG: ribosome maturation factor RimP [Gammaproteobacteria bacterium]
MRDLRADRLQKLLEPGAVALGFELVAVELVGGDGNTVLRVYIDGPAGITVDNCAAVSHQISGILEVEDPIAGNYTLEVSSPGLDRPLVKPADFERFIGENVKVKMMLPVLGRRNFKGRLVAVEGDQAVVEVDNESYDLPFAGMEKARLAPGI